MSKPAFRGGWLLVGLIIVLVFVFIVLGGVIFLLTENRKVLSHQLNHARAVYLANAGLMWAGYQFRRNEAFPLGEFTVESGPAADDVFILERGPGTEDKDFLLINATSAQVKEKKHKKKICGEKDKLDRLENWDIWNVLDDSSNPGLGTITIVGMQVEWDNPHASEKIFRVILDKKKRFEDCPSAPLSGEYFDLNKNIPVSIKGAKQWGKNYIWFSTKGVMKNKNFIKMTFFMDDNSEITATYVPGGPPGPVLRDFPVTSAGEPRTGTFPFIARRRVMADFQVDLTDLQAPNTFINYREIKAQGP